MMYFRCNDERVILPDVGGTDAILVLGIVPHHSDMGAIDAKDLERRCVDRLLTVTDDRVLWFMIDSLRGLCAEVRQSSTEPPMVTFFRAPAPAGVVVLDLDR